MMQTTIAGDFESSVEMVLLDQDELELNEQEPTIVGDGESSVELVLLDPGKIELNEQEPTIAGDGESSVEMVLLDHDDPDTPEDLYEGEPDKAVTLAEPSQAETSYEYYSEDVSELVAGESFAEKSFADEPVAGESVAEKSVAEKSVADEPFVEENADKAFEVSESAVGEPVAAEFVLDFVDDNADEVIVVEATAIGEAFYVPETVVDEFVAVESVADKSIVDFVEENKDGAFVVDEAIEFPDSNDLSRVDAAEVNESAWSLDTKEALALQVIA